MSLPPEIPQSFLNKYKHLKYMNEISGKDNGKGKVYLFVDEKESRYFALKKPECIICSKEDKEYLYNEFQYTHKYKDPSAVTVFDVSDQNEKQPWFLMDYIPGYLPRKLTEIYQKKDIRWYKLIYGISKYFSKISGKIIHRDLKPENIIIDYKYQPHIIDFGEGREFPTNTNEQQTENEKETGKENEKEKENDKEIEKEKEKEIEKETETEKETENEKEKQSKSQKHAPQSEKVSKGKKLTSKSEKPNKDQKIAPKSEKPSKKDDIFLLSIDTSVKGTPYMRPPEAYGTVRKYKKQYDNYPFALTIYYIIAGNQAVSVDLKEDLTKRIGGSLAEAIVLCLEEKSEERASFQEICDAVTKTVYEDESISYEEVDQFMAYKEFVDTNNDSFIYGTSEYYNGLENMKKDISQAKQDKKNQEKK